MHRKNKDEVIIKEHQKLVTFGETAKLLWDGKIKCLKVHINKGRTAHL